MPNVVDNVVLDPLISTIGWEYKYEDDVEITRTRNKSESRVTPVQYLVRRWQVPFQKLNKAQRLYLRQFVKGRGNTLRGFLMWDLEEFQAVLSPIGVGDGSTLAFQMSYTEGDSANSYQKPATRPVPTGTAVPYQLSTAYGSLTALTAVTVNGVAKVEGTHYSVNPLNGILTFTSGNAPTNGAPILASFLFYAPVRFDGPSITFSVDGVIGAVQGEIIELLERVP